MVFSSHLFIFYFLPLALLLYYAAPQLRVRHAVLTLLSYVFYGWANPLFVVLMLTSTLIDYCCGLVIARQWGKAWGTPIEPLAVNGERSRSQRIALFVSICSNLTLLGFFKYFNFGVASYNSLVQALGLENLNLDLAFHVTLPLGISFYTFQSMSYSIDVYRGHARAIRQPIDFFCYVSMFPQLVAGPIIRFSEVAEQLRGRTHTLEKFARGFTFVALGLTKKVMLANPCGKVADVVFDAGSASCMDSWYGVIAYSFQIYFDFSAYSDMAIGLGLMLGFMFPKNFDSPYHSKSITEFWRRWHISLSSWLRDYLYIPLGGNRKGARRTYVNLMLVMLLGGLWHGASWNFVIWGGMHGIMLCIERLYGKSKPVESGKFNVARMVFTYVVVLITWVFFRADDLPSALNYCRAMIGLQEAQAGSVLLKGIIYQPYYMGTILMSALITLAGIQTWDFTRTLNVAKITVIFGLFILSIIMMTTQAYNPFIYFIF